MNFELKYIYVEWDHKKEVTRLDISDSSIDITEYDNGLFSADTLSYIRIGENKDAYIGLHFNLNVNDTPSAIVSATKEKHELTEVQDPINGSKWWIVADKWVPKKNYYDSSPFYHMGRITIILNESEKLEITNSPANFSYSDLLSILDDFKYEIYNLVIDKNSISSVDLSKTGFAINNDSMRIIDEYFNSVRRLLRNPEKVIKTKSHLINKNKAKINVKTINQIVKNPFNKILLAEEYFEDYNTPANRFIHFTLKKIVYLLNLWNNLLEHKLKRNNLNISFERKKRKEIKEVYLQDKSELFENQMNIIGGKDELEKFNNLLLQGRKNLSLKNVNNHIFILNLIKNYAGKKNEFFVVKYQDILNIISSQNSKNLPFEYVVVEFPNNNDLLKSLNCHELYKVTVTDYKVEFCKNNSGNFYPKIIFDLSNFININININYSNKSNLKLSDDNKLLKSASEQVSIQTEKKLKDECNLILDTKKSISKLVLKGQTLLSTIRKLGVGIQSNLPNSVIFSYNPFYSNSYKFYKILIDEFSLDESKFNLLEKIERVGLKEICKIYEYWCLLLIIRTLTSSLKFEIEDSWDKKLCDSILYGDDKEICWNLTNADDSQLQNGSPIYLKLYYQKSILTSSSNYPKRPDFVIDLVKDFGNEQRLARLVLDAKFRGDESDQIEISNTLNQLFYDKYILEGVKKDGKNYSENNKNMVFIVHPSLSGVKINNKYCQVSPLIWGCDCSYGGEKEIDFNTQKYKSIVHVKGHICVRPTNDYSASLDNIKRLIVLFLQQKHSFLLINTDDNSSERHKFDDHFLYQMSKEEMIKKYPSKTLLQKDSPFIYIRKNIICCNCGSQDLHIEKHETEGGHFKFYFTCKKCNQLTVKTLCYSCGFDRLYKNGEIWTYHINAVNQLGNVFCPKCNALL